jgi:hypothetical protein
VSQYGRTFTSLLFRCAELGPDEFGHRQSKPRRFVSIQLFMLPGNVSTVQVFLFILWYLRITSLWMLGDASGCSIIFNLNLSLFLSSIIVYHETFMSRYSEMNFGQWRFDRRVGRRHCTLFHVFWNMIIERLWFDTSCSAVPWARFWSLCKKLDGLKLPERGCKWHEFRALYFWQLGHSGNIIPGAPLSFLFTARQDWWQRECSFALGSGSFVLMMGM